MKTIIAEKPSVAREIKCQPRAALHPQGAEVR